MRSVVVCRLPMNPGGVYRPPLRSHDEGLMRTGRGQPARERGVVSQWGIFLNQVVLELGWVFVGWGYTTLHSVL